MSPAKLDAYFVSPWLWWSSNDLKSSAFNDLKMWALWTTNSQFGSNPINPGVFKSPVPQHSNMFSRGGLMVLSMACVMASADDTACALQKGLGKPKIRDNYVYFHGVYLLAPVVSVQFDETSHSVTQGQPYEGVFSLGYYLDVRAGRHESEEVAHDFYAGLTPDNALGLFTDAPLPSELNFAVFGTMSLIIGNATTVCPEMRIAQGHIPATYNNWWIAGTACYHQDGIVGLTCPCDNANITFSTFDEDEFDVASS